MELNISTDWECTEDAENFVAWIAEATLEAIELGMEV